MEPMAPQPSTAIFILAASTMKSKLHCLKHFQYLEPEAISNTRSDIKKREKQALDSGLCESTGFQTWATHNFPPNESKRKRSETSCQLKGHSGIQNNKLYTSKIIKVYIKVMFVWCYMLQHATTCYGTKNALVFWSSNSFRTELSSWACCPWASWAWRQTAD